MKRTKYVKKNKKVSGKMFRYEISNSVTCVDCGLAVSGCGQYILLQQSTRSAAQTKQVHNSYTFLTEVRWGGTNHTLLIHMDHEPTSACGHTALTL